MVQHNRARLQHHTQIMRDQSSYLRRRGSSKRKSSPSIGCIAAILCAIYLLFFTAWQHFVIRPVNQDQSNSSSSPSSDSDDFIPTLRNKKILIEITTVGQSQYAYFENVLDSFRDLCEAGAKVSLHITTTNCDPSPKEGDPECPLYGQTSVETLENNYSVEKIDQMNERMRCRDPDGSLEMTIRLISPEWGKQVVDNHRRVFYDRIEDGYDVFVHSEEDERIRPTNILAFMDEMDKLRKLVGKEVSLN